MFVDLKSRAVLLILSFGLKANSFPISRKNTHTVKKQQQQQQQKALLFIRHRKTRIFLLCLIRKGVFFLFFVFYFRVFGSCFRTPTVNLLSDFVPFPRIFFFQPEDARRNCLVLKDILPIPLKKKKKNVSQRRHETLAPNIL